MYNIIRLFAVVVLGCASMHAFAVNFKVNDIRLEGLQRVSASPVFAVMPVRVGDVIDEEDIRNAIRALYSSGFFSNVQIAREDDVLIIILQERPAIKSIEFDGNKAIKTEQLTEILIDNGLSEGEILQRPILLGIARELERQYIAQARYGAEVEVNVEDLPNSLVAIKIDVDEGSAAKIRHINFVGNELYSDSELLDLFEMRPAKWYKFFSSAHKYAKERLTGDLETLESFYLDRGFLDFRVVSSQISISPDKRSVFVTLNLHEGEKYTVSEMDLAGDLILDENVVRRLFLMRAGDTFSQARMTGTAEYITTLLGNAGYTNASVEGIPELNPEENTVAVTFFVDPGKRVYVRRVEFSGNTKTSDDVLRREMRQLEGSSASNAKIEGSKIKLERLGYFKGVSVKTEDVPGFSDLIDVKFEVEEQASGSIQASVGYSDAYKTTLGLSVSENNWLGTGKRVDFGINHNRFEDSYSFNYNDPYFTPDGVSRGFSLYYRNTDLTGANFGSSYSSDSVGATVNFGYPISEISFLRFGLGIANQQLKVGNAVPSQIRQSPFFQDDVGAFGRRYDVDFAYMNQSTFEQTHSGYLTPNNLTDEFLAATFAVNDAVVIAEEPGFIDKFGNDFNSLSATLSWSRNTLNRGILPTRGNSQVLSIETKVPGSDLEYYKVRLEAKQFVPISRNFTLRFRANLGYGDGFGSMDELPFFETFRTGGIGSVRGFESLTLGPTDMAAQQYLLAYSGAQDLDENGSLSADEFLNPVYVVCDDPGVSGICEPGKLISQATGSQSRRRRASGGNVLVEFSTELILPLPFAQDTRSMQLVAFVDAGNVFSTNCRDDQINCSDLDLGELRSSYGLGYKWLSGFGPLTFSLAWPTEEKALDDTKRFQFSFGAGF